MVPRLLPRLLRRVVPQSLRQNSGPLFSAAFSDQTTPAPGGLARLDSDGSQPMLTADGCRIQPGLDGNEISNVSPKSPGGYPHRFRPGLEVRLGTRFGPGLRPGLRSSLGWRLRPRLGRRLGPGLRPGFPRRFLPSLGQGQRDRPGFEPNSVCDLRPFAHCIHHQVRHLDFPTRCPGIARWPRRIVGIRS
jgi:hypothetical protein